MNSNVDELRHSQHFIAELSNTRRYPGDKWYQQLCAFPQISPNGEGIF